MNILKNLLMPLVSFTSVAGGVAVIYLSASSFLDITSVKASASAGLQLSNNNSKPRLIMQHIGKPSTPQINPPAPSPTPSASPSASSGPSSPSLSIEQQLKKLELKQNQLKAEMAAKTQEITTLENEKKAVETNLSVVGDSMDKNDEQIEAVEDSIDEMEEKESELWDKINSIRSQEGRSPFVVEVSVLSRNLSKNKKKLQTLEKEAESLEAKQQEFQKNFDEKTAALKATKSEHDGLKKQLSDIEQEIKELKALLSSSQTTNPNP